MTSGTCSVLCSSSPILVFDVSVCLSRIHTLRQLPVCLHSLTPHTWHESNHQFPPPPNQSTNQSINQSINQRNPHITYYYLTGTTGTWRLPGAIQIGSRSRAVGSTRPGSLAMSSTMGGTMLVEPTSSLLATTHVS